MKKVVILKEKDIDCRTICSCLELLSVCYQCTSFEKEVFECLDDADLVIMVCQSIDSTKSMWESIASELYGTPVSLALNTTCKNSESYALNSGFLGVIPLTLEIESIVKAVNTLARGGLWYSRSALEIHIMDQLAARRSVSSIFFDRTALTARERRVAQLSCQGLGNKEIAESLNISPFTVKTHMQKIMRKSGVKNRTQLSAAFMG
ncbi:helix-turn-helix transcriptional regulator [Gilvimarinus agarilyticus]|uniref:helix-turn-helix transcriptional regulator n=1 Tax=Gilvimarinus agarilyticus TaxID=679259 RepID=UPI0005A0CF06|nr:response regulator transcription factor [Gilvimarinus agarilyticus]